MEGAERVRLQENYTTASAIFDAAKTRLQQRIGICPIGEFRVPYEALDRASAELERARTALEAHIWEHCCMVQEGTVTQARELI
jgi:hypothetical protein